MIHHVLMHAASGITVADKGVAISHRLCPSQDPRIQMLALFAVHKSSPCIQLLVVLQELSMDTAAYTIIEHKRSPCNHLQQQV